MRSVVERFWPKVDKRGSDECWLWTGVTKVKGYGQFHHAGRTAIAHRVAYELTHGPIPKGYGVLHRCDNPPCCNPAHLFIGSNRDNIADRHAKRRDGRLPGERHGRAKLTDAQAREIRNRYVAGGVSQRELAAEYGVHHSRIFELLARRTYNEAQEAAA